MNMVRACFPGHVAKTFHGLHPQQRRARQGERQTKLLIFGNAKIGKGQQIMPFTLMQGARHKPGNPPNKGFIRRVAGNYRGAHLYRHVRFFHNTRRLLHG